MSVLKYVSGLCQYVGLIKPAFFEARNGQILCIKCKQNVNKTFTI